MSERVKKLVYRIRKITPLEAFRLMGLKDIDYQRCKDMGISNSQLYKIAGNGIITNCITLIAEHIYKAFYDELFVCYDEAFLAKEGGNAS